MPDVPDFATIVAQSPDATIFAGTDGIIRVWNAAAERVFGYAVGEAIGQDLNIIIPERFREQHWAGFDRAIGEGRTKYEGRFLPTRALRKDGSQIYIEMGFAIVVIDGTTVGAMATARDITERFERERADRQKLRELQEQLEAAGQRSGVQPGDAGG
jgi:PAS domain S-box-containing protein